jgi:hypothetical protein
MKHPNLLRKREKMSFSRQDIDNRLRICEDKLALILQMIQVTKRTPSTLMPGHMIEEKMTGEQLYKEMKAAGGQVDTDE